MTTQGRQTASVTVALTATALVAFAFNSLLCRLALLHGAVDPASFTNLRIASGAGTLWCISAMFRGRRRPSGSWIPALMLALYALAFSYAYISLSAGTGALILMATVQATLLAGGIRAGERLLPVQWTGLFVALAGLVYLVSPGITGPPVPGSLLMGVAGVAWGIYSLRGRSGGDPVTMTTDNFIRAVPIVLCAFLLRPGAVHWSPEGVALAVLSGAVTSGVGYVFWYAALRGLTATRAGIVQLAVPVLTAVGGVAVLSEPVTGRLVIASILILGGVGAAIARRS